jgi:hypothetical protein
MFVRIKIGAYAGEVREVPFVIGKDLVDNGRADKFTFEGPAELPIAAPTPANSSIVDPPYDPPATKAAKPKRKGR